MLELPEVLTLAPQLQKSLTGKRVVAVLPPTKPHKFCWFNGDPALYDEKAAGSRVAGAEGFGIFVELALDNGCRLCFNDGVNARLTEAAQAPRDYQLLLRFEDGTALAFTVAMYGGIILHDGGYDNEYYLSSRRALSPFSPGFPAYYRELLQTSKPTLSAKAFLATQQRFPGVGNGVLQDILFAAGVHPKRKLATLSEADRERLLACLLRVIDAMIKNGGRDTEKDLFGQPGGYRVNMSKGALASGCPVCGGQVVKEAYLGGSVYYCPNCQPL